MTIKINQKKFDCRYIYDKLKCNSLCSPERDINLIEKPGYHHFLCTGNRFRSIKHHRYLIWKLGCQSIASLLTHSWLAVKMLVDNSEDMWRCGYPISEFCPVMVSQYLHLHTFAVLDFSLRVHHPGRNPIQDPTGFSRILQDPVSSHRILPRILNVNNSNHVL